MKNCLLNLGNTESAVREMERETFCSTVMSLKIRSELLESTEGFDSREIITGSGRSHKICSDAAKKSVSSDFGLIWKYGKIENLRRRLEIVSNREIYIHRYLLMPWNGA